MKINPMVYGGLALALASVGCAHKEEIAPEATPVAAAVQASPTQTPQVEAVITPAPSFHYTVRKGDTLWSIASKPAVLDDPFRWPVLFKQNRDQIQDPDLIEVQQDLAFGAPTDSQAIQKAIQEAKDTPPYSPHSEPRKSLPLNY